VSEAMPNPSASASFISLIFIGWVSSLRWFIWNRWRLLNGVVWAKGTFTGPGNL
jgi:hypothetical protein